MNPKTHDISAKQKNFRMHIDGICNFILIDCGSEIVTGDYLLLRELTDTEESFTGQVLTRKITHVSRGPKPGIEEGWAILSLEKY